MRLAGMFAALLFICLFSMNSLDAGASGPTGENLNAHISQLELEKAGLQKSIRDLESEKSTIVNNLRVTGVAKPSSSPSTSAGSPSKSVPPPTIPSAGTTTTTTKPSISKPPQPSVTINTSPDGAPMEFFAADFTTSSNIVDFPCPLRDDPDPTACKLTCEDKTCSRGVKVCNTYVECTHVVYDGKEREDLTNKVVTLKHELVKEDLSALTTAFSRWSSVMTRAEKPRTYVIISYGGSGSKMLSGWISDLPKSSVVTVKHMHDPNPPNQMRTFNRPLREASHNGDYRDRHIPGGMFSKDTALIPKDEYDNYRYVYIFKDPVEGLVSRYGHGHCVHVGGDCGSESNFPSLDQYATGGKDFFKIGDFFDKWTTPNPSREYPVLCINYHKIWDNVPSVVEALGLPEKYASTFPKRTETVRNNKTGAKEGHNNHSEDVREKLRKIYKSVRDKIFDMPAMTII